MSVHDFSWVLSSKFKRLKLVFLCVTCAKTVTKKKKKNFFLNIRNSYFLRSRVWKTNKHHCVNSRYFRRYHRLKLQTRIVLFSFNDATCPGWTCAALRTRQGKMFFKKIRMFHTYIKHKKSTHVHKKNLSKFNIGEKILLTFLNTLNDGLE